MKMNPYFYLLFSVAILAAVGCKKDPKPQDQNNTTDTTKPVIKPPKWEDTLCAVEWKVKEATNNGQNDVSSTGFELKFFKNGTYEMPQLQFTGTWEFQNNYTQILLDKALSIKTVWNIKTFNSKLLDVDFKSAFNGGASNWKMVPKY